MQRDLNELYNMVCTDRNEYLQAVQAVVTFSGLYGEELQRVLPKLQGPRPEPTLNDIRGYTPYEERDMSPYEGGQPLDDIIMGGSEAPDILVDFDIFALADAIDTVETEGVQGVLNGLTLRIEDAVF